MKITNCQGNKIRWYSYLIIKVVLEMSLVECNRFCVVCAHLYCEVVWCNDTCLVCCFNSRCILQWCQWSASYSLTLCEEIWHLLSKCLICWEPTKGISFRRRLIIHSDRQPITHWSILRQIDDQCLSNFIIRRLDTIVKWHDFILICFWLNLCEIFDLFFCLINIQGMNVYFRFICFLIALNRLILLNLCNFRLITYFHESYIYLCC